LASDSLQLPSSIMVLEWSIPHMQGNYRQQTQKAQWGLVRQAEESQASLLLRSKEGSPESIEPVIVYPGCMSQSAGPHPGSTLDSLSLRLPGKSTMQPELRTTT
jgi:hypothetical protein